MSTAVIPVERRVSAGEALGRIVTEARSVTEAMQIAGIDYTVAVSPLDRFSVVTEDGVLSTGLRGRRLLYKEETGEGLGVVRSRYEVVQTRDLFAVADGMRAAGAEFQAAGESRPGQLFLAMGLPEARARVTQVDDVIFRLLLRADHTGDGGSAWLFLRAERVWCTNGCPVSLPGLSTRMAIPHTSSAPERLREARRFMAEGIRYAKAFQVVARELRDTPMARPEFTGWVDGLFARPGEGAAAARVTRWENRRAEVLSLFDRAATQSEGRGTRWAAFNSVTEWLSWGMPTRGADDAREVRELDDRARPLRDQALASLRPQTA